jgi:asparagine synthase (glutamine-hydrolysing)
MNEPLADPAAVALYFASELASKHTGIVLSGEGVDELLGGYNIYKEPLALAPMRIIPRPVRKLLAWLVLSIPFDFKGKNYIVRASTTVEERFIGNAYIFTLSERNKILKKPAVCYPPEAVAKPYYDRVKDKDDLTKMQYIDINLWMAGDILLKADRMSAAYNLELRSPFLDMEIVNFALKLPSRHKVNKTDTKLVFRAAAKDILPPEVAKKKKLGFPVPIRVWLREEPLYSEVKEAFESTYASDYFRTEELISLLDRHKTGKKDNSRKIWTVYMFIIWYKQFFKKS